MLPPKSAATESKAANLLAAAGAGAGDAKGRAANVAAAIDAQAMHAAALAAIPEFAGFGELIKTSEKPVELTEQET